MRRICVFLVVMIFAAGAYAQSEALSAQSEALKFFTKFWSNAEFLSAASFALEGEDLSEAAVVGEEKKPVVFDYNNNGEVVNVRVGAIRYSPVDKQLHMEGAVRIRSGTRYLEAESLVYDMNAEKAHVKGKVKLGDSNTMASGDEGTYDGKTGAAVISSTRSDGCLLSLSGADPIPTNRIEAELRDGQLSKLHFKIIPGQGARIPPPAPKKVNQGGAGPVRPASPPQKPAGRRTAGELAD